MINQKKIFIFDAKKGMKIAKDVVLPDGHIIVAASTILDYALIQKISDYHILEIIIEDEISSYDIPATKKNTEQSLHYYDRVKETKDFKIFHEHYIEFVDSMKSSLNGIVLNNEPINSQALLASTKNLLHDTRNNFRLFDMLHSMREFDDLTFVHCVNVSLICTIIGRWMDFSEEDIDVLTLSGLLHDIGKLLAPNEILTKPTHLTPNEYAIMKKHVDLGYNILKDCDIDIRIKQSCLYHHERCDGSGYPEGLTSDKIPVFAKIVAIADVYDAMTAARVYRGPICPFEVVKIMEHDTFSKFDPEYAISFLHSVVSTYLHTNVRLSNGQTGEVIMINRNDLSRPVLRCGEDFYLDLSAQRGIEIEKLL